MLYHEVGKGYIIIYLVILGCRALLLSAGLSATEVGASRDFGVPGFEGWSDSILANMIWALALSRSD